MARQISSAHKGEMMQILEAWKLSGGRWPATAYQIADFAVGRKLYNVHARARQLCARDLARAMREDYLIDELGRPVRRLHAARIKVSGDDGEPTQRTFWDDIDTEDRDFLEIAFQQRRTQIAGDCRQLNNDAEYRNRRHPDEQPFQPHFDFRDDVEEGKQPGWSPPKKG